MGPVKSVASIKGNDGTSTPGRRAEESLAAPCRARAAGAHTWVTPVWPPGARVAWNGRIGMFLREAEDEQVELLIGSRTYRVRRAEVRSA